MKRVRRDAQGARIVRERRDLVPLLSDRDALLALPTDSLGHRYARFVEAEQITADGLVEASLDPGASDEIDPNDVAELELRRSARACATRTTCGTWSPATAAT